MDQLFAVAAPGLEVFVARELVAVGIAENGAGVEIGAGGVGFE